MSMTPIHVVTDSSARFLDPTTANHPLLTLASVTVRFPDQVIEDQPNLSLQDHRSLFAANPGQALADPPTVQQLERVFSELQQHTDQIISIHTSAGISSAYQNAVRASESFRGRSNIQIIDSTTLSAGLGILVTDALRAVDRGDTLDEVVRLVRGLIPRLYAVFFLDDLIYLERNGLVSKSQAILGNMMGVLPFLTVEHGQLITMEKVRNRPRAQEKLIEFVTEFSAIKHLVLLHSAPEPDEEVRLVAERLQALYPDTAIGFINYGPAAATYIGLNGMGAVVMETEEEPT